MNVGQLGQGRLRVTRDGNESGTHAPKVWGNESKLVRLSRVGEGEHEVLGLNHAQVAMLCLGGVHKEGWCPGGGKGGGELAGHVATLAHAGDHQTAFESHDPVHCLGRRGCQLCCQACNGLGLHLDHAPKAPEHGLW